MARTHGRRLRKSVIAEVIARDPWLCAYCGWRPGDPARPSPSRHWKKPPAVWQIEFDHIVPLSKGGLSKGGLSNAANLQLLCSGCNSRKGDKMPEARG